MPQFYLAVVTQKITKISKQASIFKSTTFASQRLFLVQN